MPKNGNSDKMPYRENVKTDLAYIDDLTNLYNRRYLNATLSTEISKVKKSRKKLSLFMMDCDNLKSINDAHGHLNGDRVLVELSNILKKEIDKAGTLIRYAGDEFTVVLPEKELKESRKLADNLLQTMTEHKMELKDGKKLSNVSLSIGIAVYPDDATEAEELIDKADQALYSSKRTGKSKISTVQDLVAEVHDRNLVANLLPCKSFIDRKDELALLESVFDNATKGLRKFTLIAGGDGIGKTRLMLELLNSHKGIPAFLLKCRRERVNQRYGAISDGLNKLLDSIEARDALEVLSSLKDVSKFALLSTVEVIKDLPVRYSKGRTPSLKDLKEEEIFSAFTSFIRGLRLKVMPIFIDDILWIDKGSLRVIKWMLEDAGISGVCAVGTLSKNLLKIEAAQKAPFIEFLGSESLRQILETVDLAPFTKETVSELLKGIFSASLFPPAVEEKIFSLSWGYPSNVEEIVKHLVENKIVYPKQGKWVFDEKCIDKMPASLKDLLDKRIAALDDESKEVLSKASVLGDDFDIEILKSLHGKNEGELLDILDRLREKGIFEQNPMSRETTLSFVNNIVRDSIYSTMKRSDARQLHKKAAELMQQFELSRIYGQLRHHLQEAGETEKIRSFLDEFELPPYARTAIEEEEAEPSVEELIEAPLSEKSEKIVPDLISYLRATWVNSQLYPRDNKTRMESVENLYKRVQQVFENDPTLTVSASGENIILNGRLIDRRSTNIMISRALASLFADYGIEGVTLKRGLGKKDLEEFFSLFAEKQDGIDEAGGLSRLMKKKNIAKIKVNEVSYKKVSDLTASWRRTLDAFKQMLPMSPAISNLFSIDDKGLAINRDVLSDPKRAIDSIFNAAAAISEQNVSEDNKSFMILEGIHKVVDELSKRDAPGWEQGKKRLGELILSLDPHLRTKIIKDSSKYGPDVASCITDILSTLDKNGIAKILDDARQKIKISPEEFEELLKVVIKSQYPKKLSYEEALRLMKESGMDNEAATRVMDTVATRSFFDDVANELIESETPGVWERKSIDNLKPLTEALIIKNDTKTIEKLVESLLVRMKTKEPSLRISAIEGIGRVLEALLEKEVFDIASTIGAELSKQLKTEDNINIYIEYLKDLEMMINTLIQKENLQLLVLPLKAIGEELTLPEERPVEFKSYAEGTLNRITSPKNMETLLFSFRKKAENEYIPIVKLLAQLGKKVLEPLMTLLSVRDDVKLDPFDVYRKKQYIALIMKEIGGEAASRLGNSINDKRPFVVKNIVEVFGFINDSKYIPYLEKLNNYPDGEIRKEAANILKKLKLKH